MLLFGSGGHAKVLIDTAELSGDTIDLLFDDNPPSEHFLGIPTHKGYDASILRDQKMLISIGNNEIRKLKTAQIKHAYGVLIHPSAAVSKYAKVGEGSVILPNAVLNAHASVGKHVILNSGAIVDHDCTVADFVHVGPNATMYGNSHVGEGSVLGAGVVVERGVKIGKWCKIKAGSVVSNDVEDFKECF